MLEILKKLLVSGEAALIYTDDQNTSKFHYGIICGVNDTEVSINMFNQSGNYDGIIMISSDIVYRIEIDGQYHKKMEKLCSNTTKSFERLNNDNIKNSLLNLALETQKIVSLELMNSGCYDIVGFVSNLNDHICQIKVIDEYGLEDGKAFILTEGITKICYDSEDENNIFKLWEINRNTRNTGDGSAC